MHELFQSQEPTCPALLIGLALEPIFFRYAREVYKRNALMTAHNETAFRRISVAKIYKVHHLKIVTPILFQAQLIALTENLVSIEIDATAMATITEEHVGHVTDTITVLEKITAASKKHQKSRSSP
jgi:hypothetical protein